MRGHQPKMNIKGVGAYGEHGLRNDQRMDRVPAVNMASNDKVKAGPQALGFYLT